MKHCKTGGFGRACKRHCGWMIAGFVLLVLSGGVVVWQLWNALLPELFGWKSISYMQALGLLLLSRLLFGSCARCQHKCRERCVINSPELEGLSPEERLALQKGIQHDQKPD